MACIVFMVLTNSFSRFNFAKSMPILITKTTDYKTVEGLPQKLRYLFDSMAYSAILLKLQVVYTYILQLRQDYIA